MSPTPSRLQGERVTLPPIRDILGDELAHPSTSQHVSQSPTFSLRPLNSALNGDGSPRVPMRDLSRSSSALRLVHHDEHFDYRVINDSSSNGSSVSSRATTSYNTRDSPPYYEGIHSPRSRSFERIHDSQRRSASSSSLPPPDHSFQSQRSQLHSYHDTLQPLASGFSRQPMKTPGYSRPLLHPDDGHWGHHRRRDSTESSWSSSHSSSGLSSPQVQDFPKPGGLQFQPLPASHLSSHFARMHAGTLPQTPSPDQQSPFGVLIADVGTEGAPPSDPQRLAILRTLRASGSAITLSPAFEDFQNARAGLATARYECPYCRKRFNRPSSLKIHINSHTGEKPFQCTHPNCGRRFSVQSNMRRHMRVHTTPGLQVPDESSGDEESSQSTSTDTPSMSPQIRPTLAPLEMSYPKPPLESNESTPRPGPSPRRSRSVQSLSFSVPQSHVRTSSETPQSSPHWQRKPSSR